MPVAGITDNGDGSYTMSSPKGHAYVLFSPIYPAPNHKFFEDEAPEDVDVLPPPPDPVYQLVLHIQSHDRHGWSLLSDDEHHYPSVKEGKKAAAPILKEADAAWDAMLVAQSKFEALQFTPPPTPKQP